MLSRIARGMYELGRRIESAENVTRILDVNYRMSLELDYFSDLDVWSPMLAITGSRAKFDELYDELNEENVYDFCCFAKRTRTLWLSVFAWPVNMPAPCESVSPRRCGSI